MPVNVVSGAIEAELDDDKVNFLPIFFAILKVKLEQQETSDKQEIREQRETLVSWTRHLAICFKRQLTFYTHESVSRAA